jgi:hypothetical protein
MPGLTAPSMRKPSWLRFLPSSRPVSPVSTTSGRKSEPIANYRQVGVEVMLEVGGFIKQNWNFLVASIGYRVS